MIASQHRFHGLGSLRRTYAHGKALRTGQLSLRYQLNTRRKTYRAAVVVSKKIHKSAVKRNRVRRRIYEAVRLREDKIAEPYEFIITVFSDQVIDWPADKLMKEVNHLLVKAKITGR